MTWRKIGAAPWELLLVLAVWSYVFPYSVGLNNPNERTRVMQARAIVERGQLSIGEVYQDEQGRWLARDLYGHEHGYDHRRGNAFVNDVALVCTEPDLEPPACAGLIYPAKAPGTALLGVPALAAARSVGFIDDGPAGEARATWVLRYGASVPLMLLGFWAFGWLLRISGFSRSFSGRATLAAALGTTAFSYGVMFVGHALASAALVLGVAALVRARHSVGRRGHALAALGGLSAASAVLLEYHAAIAVAPIAIWVVVDSARRRLVGGFAVGSGLALALFAALHQAMFLSPIKTGHFYLMSAHNRASQSTGFLGIEGFTWNGLGTHLFDEYMGLVPFMPWLFALGLLVGVPLLLRGRRSQLPVGAGRALAAIVLLYLLFVACLGKVRMMNGWSIGPRYLLPAVLPLAFCAAVAWGWIEERAFVVGRTLTGLVVAAMVVIGVMTVAFPSPPNSIQSPFGEFALPLLQEGWSVRHLGLVLGVGLLPLWLLLGGAAAWITLGPAPAGVALRRRLIAGVLAIALGAGWAVALQRRGETPTLELRKAHDWAITVVEGQSPDEDRPFFPPRPAR